MVKGLLRWVSWGVTVVLLFFTARRWLFMLFALSSQRTDSSKSIASSKNGEVAPHILLLVPIRNEADGLPALLDAFDQLSYDRTCLRIVLIDDGSTDDSHRVMSRWAKTRDHCQILALPQNVGKAQALNQALAEVSFGDIIAIYDADERPEPNTLHRLVQPFADPHVGGVSGRRAVSNALASPVASYTTFEGIVHQLVTMQAKDKLHLAPAILGANCAYRRTALSAVGGFRPGALLEDSDLTVKLARAGWRVRFEPSAISYHEVPQTVVGYWRQHTRWA
ncbi:MAG: glycosyltransferase family 2 protein, partial [Chloroflexota bacterium]